MKRKKKVAFLSTMFLLLLMLALASAVVYLHSQPDSQLAQYLEREGVPVQTIVNQPHVATVSRRIEGLIPALSADAEGPNQSRQSPSPDVFKDVSIKGVMGMDADGSALIEAGGETRTVRVGEQFSFKTARGNITMRCDEIRPGAVILSIANSDLRKEYALR